MEEGGKDDGCFVFDIMLAHRLPVFLFVCMKTKKFTPFFSEDRNEMQIVTRPPLPFVVVLWREAACWS